MTNTTWGSNGLATTALRSSAVFLQMLLNRGSSMASQRFLARRALDQL